MCPGLQSVVLPQAETIGSMSSELLPHPNRQLEALLVAMVPGEEEQIPKPHPKIPSHPPSSHPSLRECQSTLLYIPPHPSSRLLPP